MLSDNAAKPAEKADYGDFLNTVHNLMNKNPQNRIKIKLNHKSNPIGSLKLK